jgi:predicted glutamine amidotransferase
MCRLAAFPPGFSRNDAMDVLMDMEGRNKDGVGSAYVDDKGSFHTFRFPGSLTALRHHSKKDLFLSHMPHNGWTIAHLRMGTHGDNIKRNTHPFIAGEWAVVHNGVWSEYEGAKIALSKSIRFRGDTDSEVAAHVINIIGPKKFAENASGGVYIVLNRNGQLWICKTSGSVDIICRKGCTLVASDLMRYRLSNPMGLGWQHYSKTGKMIDQRVTDDDMPIGFMHGFRGIEDDVPLDYDEFKPTKRFGCNVYAYPKTPSHTKINSLAGWRLNEHGVWEKDIQPVKDKVVRYGFGADGFPIRPHCTGAKDINKIIEVPRDPDVLTYDDKGMPRWPGQKTMITIKQTKLP